MKLTEACINKPVFAWMLMAGTVLFGIVAASRIGISQMPDVDFPTINVSVNWEGAAPEVVENDVLQPLEEALVQVEGVTGLTSTARQGGGSVTVELDLSRDVDLALQDVTAKVQQAQRNLPRDIDPPVISKSNPEDQPIMWIGLTGPYSRQFIADYARYRVKERLQTVPGIGEITEGGSIERNVRIWVDSSALDSRNLTVGDVTRALVREHVELPAGRIEVPGREVNVRVLGEAACVGLVVGGDRTLVGEVLEDARLRGIRDLPRRELYDLPDPNRAVLDRAIERGRAVRVTISDGGS